MVQDIIETDPVGELQLKVFLKPRAHGFDVWEEPMVTLRLPKLFSLHADPCERADHERMGYQRTFTNVLRGQVDSSGFDRFEPEQISGISAPALAPPSFPQMPPATQRCRS